MDSEDTDGVIYQIWIDWDNRVICFRQTQGFEPMCFSTHDGMFGFAMERCLCGFKVQ